MCTVIVRVPEDASAPTRVLAVRDEDPARAWDPPGMWWPDTHPGVLGVRDARAGGAWLAADPHRRRFAVILNRAEVPGATASRGAVVLDAVDGHVPTHPRTNGFNLVVVDDSGTSVLSWQGEDVRTVRLEPGVHMIAHDDVDDPATPRIARWLGEFAAAADDGDGWQDAWMRVLARTAELPAIDDRAIVRDNRPYGVGTLSLLVCAAEVDADGVRVAYGVFAEPGRWNPLELRPAEGGVSPTS